MIYPAPFGILDWLIVFPIYCFNGCTVLDRSSENPTTECLVVTGVSINVSGPHR